MTKSNTKVECPFYKKIAPQIIHHISYLPQKTINVCFDCHKKIHTGKIQGYCDYTERQKQIFYAKKKWIEFGCSRSIPINNLYKDRHDGMVFTFGRPLTEKEKFLRTEMKKSKELVR